MILPRDADVWLSARMLERAHQNLRTFATAAQRHSALFERAREITDKSNAYVAGDAGVDSEEKGIPSEVRRSKDEGRERRMRYAGQERD